LLRWAGLSSHENIQLNSRAPSIREEEGLLEEEKNELGLLEEEKNELGLLEEEKNELGL
jgi:hypothetical protein